MPRPTPWPIVHSTGRGWLQKQAWQLRRSRPQAPPPKAELFVALTTLPPVAQIVQQLLIMSLSSPKPLSLLVSSNTQETHSMMCSYLPS